MQLTFRDEGLGDELVVPLRRELLDALAIQWARCATPEALNEWGLRLRATLEPTITATLDWDLRPPSKAQVDYAMAIAKTLRIALPGEALSHQGAMREFLDRYAASYKARSEVL